MSAKEARDNFSDLLGSVYYSKEPVIVEKQGRVFAVVISPEDYERLLRGREEHFSVFEDIHRYNLDREPEAIEEDVARELAAYREEKASERKAANAQSRH